MHLKTSVRAFSLLRFLIPCDSFPPCFLAGGVIGTSVSAVFLFFLGTVNLVVLVGIIKNWIRITRAQRQIAEANQRRIATAPTPDTQGLSTSSSSTELTAIVTITPSPAASPSSSSPPPSFSSPRPDDKPSYSATTPSSHLNLESDRPLTPAEYEQLVREASLSTGVLARCCPSILRLVGLFRFFPPFLVPFLCFHSSSLELEVDLLYSLLAFSFLDFSLLLSFSPLFPLPLCALFLHKFQLFSAFFFCLSGIFSDRPWKLYFVGLLFGLGKKPFLLLFLCWSFTCLVFLLFFIRFRHRIGGPATLIALESSSDCT